MRVILLTDVFDLEKRLAQRLKLPVVIGGKFDLDWITSTADGASGGFILADYPSTLDEALFLDRALARRAIEIDAFVWASASDPDDREVNLINHYHKVLVQVDAHGDADVVVEKVLDGLRETVNLA